MFKYFLIFLIIQYLDASTNEPETTINSHKLPTVFVAILVRNKVAVLPYFLTLFSRIDYPKDRITLWIRSDHNEDESPSVLETWIQTSTAAEYHSINITIDYSFRKFEDENSIASWTQSRYNLIIGLREEALQTSRQAWADFIWFLDCDSLLTNVYVLKNLIQHGKTVVAPMLVSDSMYSNFWCGMTLSYYYTRTDEYEEILTRKKTGCFPVPMVHSAVLIDLKCYSSDLLTFLPSKIPDYVGPVDDIIAFAVGANKSGVPLYICNDLKYGYTTVPLEENESMVDDREKLLNLKLHVTIDGIPFPVDESLSPYVKSPAKTKFGFDEIFVINLERRSERKVRMSYCLDELGIDATFVNAVDGKFLTEDELDEMGVTLMAGYEDPYQKRPMKKGEIGCFLSHYKIWEKIIEDKLHEVLVLEDDVRFEKYFIKKLRHLLDEVRRFPSTWDLVYVGRKIMKPENESFVEGSEILVYPSYTYWTIGYIINQEGAAKLLQSKPLSKLIPVDEFLPIMFDRHPRDDWKGNFPSRNFHALSVNPLIIFPVKYTNEEGYVSDTEDSKVAMGKQKKREEL